MRPEWVVESGRNTHELLIRTTSNDDWSSFVSIHPGAMRWALKSIGPAKQPYWFYAPNLIAYDPTNGTDSIGALTIAGPGGQIQ
jgi:hypothetical protein